MKHYCLLALFLLCGTTRADLQFVPSSDARDKDIRAALIRFDEAIIEGDIARAESMFAGSQEQRALINSMALFAKSHAALHEKIITRFDDDAWNQNFLPACLAAPQDATHLPLFANGDYAVVGSTQLFDGGQQLHRDPSRGWLITAYDPTAGADSIKATIELLAKWQKLDEATASDISSGKIDSPASLGVAAKQYDGPFHDYFRAVIAPDGPTPVTVALLTATGSAAPPPTAEDWRNGVGSDISKTAVSRLVASFPDLPVVRVSGKSWSAGSPLTGVELHFFGDDRKLLTVRFSAYRQNPWRDYTGSLPVGLHLKETVGDAECTLGIPPFSYGGTPAEGYNICYPDRGIELRYLLPFPHNLDNKLDRISLVPVDPTAAEVVAALPDKPGNGLTLHAIDSRHAIPDSDTVSLPGTDIFSGPSTTPGTPLRVVRSPLVSDGEINSFGMTHVGKEDVIRLEFNVDAAKRLAEYTRNHVGEALVMMIDDTVIMAPRINCEVSKSIVLTPGASATNYHRNILVFRRIHALRSRLPAAATQPTTRASK